MRLKNYAFALFISLTCIAVNVHASSQLGFGAYTLNKDTLNMGDTLLITSYIHNYDTAAYNDYITFGLKINGIQNVNQVIFPNPYYDQIININPGDSLIAKMKIIITPSYFDIGPDILVVWPIAHDGSAQVNNIDTQIIVRERGVGIKELSETPQLKVFYTDKFIHLVAADPQLTFNHVLVYDLTGRDLLNQAADGSRPIPFNPESSGTYLVAVHFNNGETRVYRVIK